MPQDQSPKPFDDAKAKRLEKLVSQLGRRYENCTFESFEYSANEETRADQSKIVGELKQYSENMIARSKLGIGIAMFGTVGTGKDHLLSAMLKLAIDRDAKVQFRNGISMIREFRGVMEKKTTESAVLDPLIECNILAISDPLPPCGGVTDFAKEKFFEIIDRRYRDMRPTWVTMNVTGRQDADDRLGVQIVDRLTDGALCLSFDWPSHRLSRRWSGE